MNIKPSGQQVEKWIAKASSEGGKILDPNKLAGLAAAWGAAQAQQPTVEEPELPEAAKCEGGWGEPCVYYYTSRQMHDHFQAGVRAGAAGSQDAKLISLLKEARKIIRASSSRNLVKDWDQRATAAMQGDRQ